MNIIYSKTSLTTTANANNKLGDMRRQTNEMPEDEQKKKQQ